MFIPLLDGRILLDGGKLINQIITPDFFLINYRHCFPWWVEEPGLHNIFVGVRNVVNMFMYINVII